MTIAVTELHGRLIENPVKEKMITTSGLNGNDFAITVSKFHRIKGFRSLENGLKGKYVNELCFFKAEKGD